MTQAIATTKDEGTSAGGPYHRRQRSNNSEQFRWQQRFVALTTEGVAAPTVIKVKVAADV